MQQNDIKRVLISVTDKTGIVEFAQGLRTFGVEILSTGGTAAQLRKSGIPVIDVSDYTGFPEMMDGRLKTLHPKIHGGLLALRDNPGHMNALREHGINLIDMVVINLYRFEDTVAKEGCVRWNTPSKTSTSAAPRCSARPPRTTASSPSSPIRRTTRKSSRR